MDKTTFICELKNAKNVEQVKSICSEYVKTVKDDTWLHEEVIDLCEFSLQTKVIYGMLVHANWNRDLKLIYWQILKDYTEGEDVNHPAINQVFSYVGLLSNKTIIKFLEKQKEKIDVDQVKYGNKKMKVTNHGKTYELGICEGLYHTNSFSTAIAFIREQAIFSRQYGEQHWTELQTSQLSDEQDKVMGIYNDLFFDNCDVNLFLDHRPSAYGPIAFVFDEEKLLSNDSLKVRITRENPWKQDVKGELPLGDRYFMMTAGLKSKVKQLEQSNRPNNNFRTQFQCHTTIWDQDKIPLKDNLKFILIEQAPKYPNAALNVKQALEKELALVGLSEIPVYIRDYFNDDEKVTYVFSNHEATLWGLDCYN